MIVKHTNYFHRPIINLIWGGVLIYDLKNKKALLLHRIYSVLLLSVFGYGYMLTEILHIYRHFNELEELTLTLCYLIAHFIGIGKITLMTVKRKEIGEFISSLEQEAFQPNINRGGIAEEAIIKKAVDQISTQARIFLIAVTSMIGSRILICAIKNSEIIYDPTLNITKITRIHPYPSTIPLPIDDSHSPYYELSFCYRTFSIILFGWYLGNCDIIITGLMIHVTAQFKILTNAVLTVSRRAEMLTQHDGNDCSSENYNQAMLKNLKICVMDCIKHHYKILNLLDNLENTFSMLFLIELLGSLLVLCVGLYQTSLLPISNPSFISMSSFTIAIAFQLVIYCYNGNELSIHSLGVGDAAYNAEWINANKDIKLSLMLMNLRAQRACFLTAGKFSKLSLETFISIMRGSASYFMVLRQMNEEISAEI